MLPAAFFVMSCSSTLLCRFRCACFGDLLVLSVIQYNVLVASTLSELKSPSATKVLWCGWKNILNEPNICELQFSMFRTTHFAVKSTQNGLLSIGKYLKHLSQHGMRCDTSRSCDAGRSNCCMLCLPACNQQWQQQHSVMSAEAFSGTCASPRAAQSPLKCEMSVEDTLRADIIRGVVTTVAALLLFINAGRLSRSQWFRLTGGGLMGVTGFAVILLLLVMR